MSVHVDDWQWISSHRKPNLLIGQSTIEERKATKTYLVVLEQPKNISKRRTARPSSLFEAKTLGGIARSCVMNGQRTLLLAGSGATVRPSNVALAPDSRMLSGIVTSTCDDSGTINGREASACGAIGVRRVHGTDGATSAPPAERLSAKSDSKSLSVSQQKGLSEIRSYDLSVPAAGNRIYSSYRLDREGESALVVALLP